MLRFCWLIFIGVSRNFCFAEPAGNNQVILEKKLLRKPIGKWVRW